MYTKRFCCFLSFKKLISLHLVSYKIKYNFVVFMIISSVWLDLQCGLLKPIFKSIQWVGQSV